MTAVNGTPGGGASWSGQSITILSGSNRRLILFGAQEQSVAPTSVSCVIGSTTLTVVGKSENSGGPEGLYCWEATEAQLTTIGTGSKSITFTPSGGGGLQGRSWGQVQLTSADQGSLAAKFYAANDAVGSTPATVNTTVAGANAIIVAAVAHNTTGAGGACTPGSGYTEDIDADDGGGDSHFYLEHSTSSPSTGTVAASVTTPNTQWAIGAVVVENVASAGTTVTPAPAALTLAGNVPATSAFTSVRIREVLITASGQVVANAANIRLMVWYSGQAIGAPDVSVNGQTTDANGTTSWSIATGTLVYNTPIFYVAQDSVSYVNYTCARMTPSYE